MVNRVKFIDGLTVKVIAMGLLVSGLFSGPLQAGTLEPPGDAVTGGGDPAPTMKTLDPIPPTWSQRLSCATQANCPRFEVLSRFVNGFLEEWGVLDHETGVVWEKSPSQTQERTWSQARGDCANLSKGGRKGWLLPSINRLNSLVDPDNGGGNPDLPPGHPFSNVQPTRYWAASTFATNPTNAWVVNFSNGNVFNNLKSTPLSVWCMRGDQKSMAAY